MTREEAVALMEELAPLVYTDELRKHEEEVKALYWEVCGLTLAKCHCPNKFSDALVEVRKRLKSEIPMANEVKHRLNRGVIIWLDNSPYNNSNLTDEVAAEYLSRYPGNAELFERVPEQEAEQEPEQEPEVSEVAEQAEDAENEVPEPEQEAAPKKKSTKKSDE